MLLAQPPEAKSFASETLFYYRKIIFLHDFSTELEKEQLKQMGNMGYSKNRLKKWFKKGDGIVIITEEQIYLDTNFSNKLEALEFISKQAKQQGIVDSSANVLRDFLLREEEYSTAVQEGIAIPHAKSSAVLTPKLIFVKLNEAIDWESKDYKVKVIFAIMVPNEDAGTEYIKILSNIAANLLEEDFQEQIFAVQSKEQTLDIICNYGKEN